MSFQCLRLLQSPDLARKDSWVPLRHACNCNANTEQALLSGDITTEVLARQRLGWFYFYFLRLRQNIEYCCAYFLTFSVFLFISVIKKDAMITKHLLDTTFCTTVPFFKFETYSSFDPDSQTWLHKSCHIKNISINLL